MINIIIALPTVSHFTNKRVILHAMSIILSCSQYCGLLLSSLFYLFVLPWRLNFPTGINKKSSWVFFCRHHNKPRSICSPSLFTQCLFTARRVCISGRFTGSRMKTIKWSKKQQPSSCTRLYETEVGQVNLVCSQARTPGVMALKASALHGLVVEEINRRRRRRVEGTSQMDNCM